MDGRRARRDRARATRFRARFRAEVGGNAFVGTAPLGVIFDHRGDHDLVGRGVRHEPRELGPNPRGATDDDRATL
jgi:hypothetical protein